MAEDYKDPTYQNLEVEFLEELNLLRQSLPPSFFLPLLAMDKYS